MSDELTCRADTQQPRGTVAPVHLYSGGSPVQMFAGIAAQSWFPCGTAQHDWLPPTSYPPRAPAPPQLCGACGESMEREEAAESVCYACKRAYHRKCGFETHYLSVCKGCLAEGRQIPDSHSYLWRLRMQVEDRE